MVGGQMVRWLLFYEWSGFGAFFSVQVQNDIHTSYVWSIDMAGSPFDIDLSFLEYNFQHVYGPDMGGV